MFERVNVQRHVSQNRRREDEKVLRVSTDHGRGGEVGGGGELRCVCS